MVWAMTATQTTTTTPRKARKVRTLAAVPEPTPAVEEQPEKPKRKAVPNAERRNETTHPDGAAAVAHGKCPACQARKGTLCTAATGNPTKHVHAGRMKAWEQAQAKAGR